MREQIQQWLGQRVRVQYLVGSNTDGIACLEEVNGTLHAVDSLGVVLTNEDDWMDYQAYPAERRWGRRTYCIPWTGIASVSQCVPQEKE